MNQGTGKAPIFPVTLSEALIRIVTRPYGCERSRMLDAVSLFNQTEESEQTNLIAALFALRLIPANQEMTADTHTAHTDLDETEQRLLMETGLANEFIRPFDMPFKGMSSEEMVDEIVRQLRLCKDSLNVQLLILHTAWETLGCLPPVFTLDKEHSFPKTLADAERDQTLSEHPRPFAYVCALLHTGVALKDVISYILSRRYKAKLRDALLSWAADHCDAPGGNHAAGLVLLLPAGTSLLLRRSETPSDTSPDDEEKVH